MTELEAFRQSVDTFIERTGMTPTKFGEAFANDPSFVFELKNGREPRTATRQRILDAMSAVEAAE